jgi:hypothetical protein
MRDIYDVQCLVWNLPATKRPTAREDQGPLLRSLLHELQGFHVPQEKDNP